MVWVDILCNLNILLEIMLVGYKCLGWFTLNRLPIDTVCKIQFFVISKWDRILGYFDWFVFYYELLRYHSF